MSVVLLSRQSYCHAQKRPFLPSTPKSGSYPTCDGESGCRATSSECDDTAQILSAKEKVAVPEKIGSGKAGKHSSWHSACRLACRGEARTPLSKIAQRKERDTMRKRNRTITIRCTDDEYERIHNKAQRHKLSLSDFVLRSAMDKKIIVADGLDEVAKQQKAIGRNLNQIAMLAHEGRLHSVRLDELIEQHRAVTAAVCDIAKEVR